MQTSTRCVNREREFTDGNTKCKGCPSLLSEMVFFLQVRHLVTISSRNANAKFNAQLFFQAMNMSRYLPSKEHSPSIAFVLEFIMSKSRRSGHIDFDIKSLSQKDKMLSLLASKAVYFCCWNIEKGNTRLLCPSIYPSTPVCVRWKYSNGKS